LSWTSPSLLWDYLIHQNHCQYRQASNQSSD
jgi:hypothetical protein